MKELIIKKCKKCGAQVIVLKDCTCDNCGIMCCKEQMTEIKFNSVDAAVEKHLPTYEIKGDLLEVTVNHVMDEDHYIEWIAYITDKKETYINLNPGEEAKTTFNYDGKGIIYSSCNKHGIWKNEIK